MGARKTNKSVTEHTHDDRKTGSYCWEGFFHDYAKLRRPPKRDKKSWIRIIMLIDQGYKFSGQVSKQYWKHSSCRHNIPQTMAELEQLYIELRIVKDHKEFKKLLHTYYEKYAETYDIIRKEGKYRLCRIEPNHE